MKIEEIKKEDVQALCQGYSIETTPRSFTKLAPLASYLPEGTKVYVTHLPGAGLADTVRVAEAIAAQGYQAIPHIAVRNLSSEQELEMGLIRLNKAGIGDILLLAGSAGSSTHYRDTIDFLQSGILELYDIHSVGFAAHPEGHPFVAQQEIERALIFKQNYAHQHPREYYLMTQFCFTAEPVLQWCASLSEREIDFPVRIGIPGVAGTAALIKHAKACGVGASLNFLLKNGGTLRRLMGVSEPNKLIMDLSLARAKAELSAQHQLHFYPLGDFQKTSDWVNAILMGRFTVTRNKGITLEK